MSKREWKPGDVAVVRATFGPNGDEPREYVASRFDGGWALLSDFEEHWYDGNHEYACDPIRPLVTLDPEDREAVERLSSLVEANGGPRFNAQGVGTLAAALREFANPQEPRPEEPTGLGAVVEAFCGCSYEARRFVRDPAARDFNLPWDAKGVARGDEVPWVAACGHHRYADLSAVRVLSPGVEVES